MDALPFMLLQRVLHGCSGDLQRGADVPEEPATSASASSSMCPHPSATAASVEGSVIEPAEVASTRRRMRETSQATASVPEHSLAPSPDSAQRVRRVSGLPLQLKLAAVNATVAREASDVVQAFSMQPPPATEAPESLQRQPGGRFLWDALQNRPCGPVCRVHDEFPVVILKCGKHATLQAWGEIGGEFGLHDRRLEASMASDTLHHWTAARCNLRTRLGPWESRRPPWADNVMPGGWLHNRVADVTPAEGRRTGYHGTSMQMLERSMKQGMETGWNGLLRKRTRHFGVYYHVLERAHLCHNYMMYSALDSTGFLFSPVIEISAPTPDPQGRREVVRTKGENQNLTYPDVCRVVGVWLHVLHVLQFWEGPATSWVYAEPRFARHLELDPDEDRALIEQRSREAVPLPS